MRLVDADKVAIQLKENADIRVVHVSGLTESNSAISTEKAIEIVRAGGVDSIEKDCDNCEYSRVVGDRYECDMDACAYRPMTQLTDGITECCGYDFGLDGFGKSKERINYCPVCGKKIWK